MRRDIPFRQVLASIGQSQLMQAYDNPLAEQGPLTVQALLTRRDLGDDLGYSDSGGESLLLACRQWTRGPTSVLPPSRRRV